MMNILIITTIVSAIFVVSTVLKDRKDYFDYYGKK
jgi:hypothetical protein